MAHQLPLMKHHATTEDAEVAEDVDWWCRAALQRPIDLFDVRRFDSQLGQSLEMLAAAHRAWQAGGRRSAEVLVDGQPIKDLCLTFVLPGAPLASWLPLDLALRVYCCTDSDTSTWLASSLVQLMSPSLLQHLDFRATEAENDYKTGCMLALSMRA